MAHSTVVNNTPAEHGSQADSYRCPQCGSSRIGTGYPDIECHACGWSEPLIDFPISWDWHRYYCREYGLPDPGPCEPLEYTLGELHARLASIEEKLACLSEQERRRLGLKAIWEEVKQLRLGLRHTQKLIPRKPAGMKRSSLKAKKTRGFVIDERAES